MIPLLSAMDSGPSKKRTSLVVVCQVFFPDPQATSQLLSELLADLADEFATVEVLSGRPGARAQVPAAPKQEQWRGIVIRRGGFSGNWLPKSLRRAVAYLSFSAWFSWRLLFYVSSDVDVLVGTNPPFAPVVAWLCARLQRRRFDLMLQDIYPDGLTALGVLAPDSFAVRVWQALNRRAIRAARRVLVIGRDMGELCISRYGAPREKIFYFPHWSVVSPTQRSGPGSNAILARLNVGNEFVVQYSGNMGLWSDISSIIDAATILQDDRSVRFLMIGDGRRAESAKKICRERRLRNVMWLPYFPREELGESLAACHAALVSQRSGLTGVAVPSKLYGIMAVGRAIIAQVPADSEVALVVQEESCGIWVEPDSPDALAKAIRRLASEPSQAEAMGVRAFAAYAAKYSLGRARQSFRSLYGFASLEAASFAPRS